jgi:hypothetical protein
MIREPRTEIGQITRIGTKPSADYGKGYKTFFIRTFFSPGGDGEGRFGILRDSAKGFKIGDFVLIKTNGEVFDPIITEIEHLPIPTGYRPSICCATCDKFSKSHYTSIPDSCDRFNTLLHKNTVCDEHPAFRKKDGSD